MASGDPFRLSPIHPGLHAGLGYTALKVSEDAHHSEYGLPSRSRGVDGLLVQEQVDLGAVQLPKTLIRSTSERPRRSTLPHRTCGGWHPSAWRPDQAACRDLWRH
jgi:hypothetical protein